MFAFSLSCLSLYSINKFNSLLFQLFVCFCYFSTTNERKQNSISISCFASEECRITILAFGCVWFGAQFSFVTTVYLVEICSNCHFSSIVVVHSFFFFRRFGVLIFYHDYCHSCQQIYGRHYFICFCVSAYTGFFKCVKFGICGSRKAAIFFLSALNDLF